MNESKVPMIRFQFLGVIFVMVCAMFSSVALGQTPALKERVEVVKSSFQQSQALLRKYEWIEVQVVTFKGEEKSRKQSRCYYGADGNLQKVEENKTTADAPRGIRGKVAKNKKEELTDYMKQAVAAIKHYVPPDPALIQNSYQGGRAAIYPTQPGKLAEISFSSYLKPNDNLLVQIDSANNRIAGAQVQTYIDDPKDAVSLNVTYLTFPDGTIYPSQVTLNAVAKNLVIKIQNSGYRLTGQ